MPDANPHSSGEEESQSTAEAVLESIEAGKSLSTLLMLLDMGALTEEQRNLLDLLRSMEDEDELSGAWDEGSRTDASDDDDSNHRDPEPEELRNLRREVADLREVNDTAAAALGACPVCWGGDAACPLCAGEGLPGSMALDEALYRALVEPATKRWHQQRLGRTGPAQA